MIKTLEKPIPESYWVIADRFLAGEYPGSSFLEERARRNIDTFLEHGFTAFFDLTRPGELLPYKPVLIDQAAAHGVEVIYRRFPIGDFGLPTPQNMQAALDAIDQALDEGRKVYLHCWGGIGRTGTTVGCYLVRHGLTGDQALAQITEWWQNVPKRISNPCSPETDAQREFVRNWPEG
jgi:hypothetical protein